jgi:hypothetical protein
MKGAKNIGQPPINRSIQHLDPLAAFQKEFKLLGKACPFEQERQIT